MEKFPNYDDLVGYRTPTQRKIEGQMAQIMADMKRIDAVVADGTFEQLKALHVELDGTYQNRIKNWGTSMYNYMQGMGFNYNYIDDDTLRENLTTMKGKLRGLLFDIDPSAETKAEPKEIHNTSENFHKSKDVSTREEASMVKSENRSNMYDRIKRRKFDVVKEYARIWKLFNTGDLVGPRAMPLIEYLDGNIQFFPDSFKGRALTLDDFNDIYDFRFDAPDDNVTVDELISYCEYVITLCEHLWKYASISLDDDAEYLRDDLYRTVESCMDELGLVAAQKDGITIFVDKDPVVLAAAELVDDSLAYDVKAFIHKQTKGDLEKKKTILKFLADEIEPKRKLLNANNLSGLADLLFQMLHRFVRHNNDNNAYISSLSPEELEACYDDTYQLWLLATVEIDNIERKKRVKTLLGKINTPTEK